MLDDNLLRLILTLAAALGCGLIAGVYFAFSTFVMQALARLPVGQGIAAMQAINEVVLNRWFLGVFFGTAVVSVIAIVAAVRLWPMPEALFLLGGSVLYLVGSFLVTILFNVPENDALAALPAEDARNDEAWARYLSSWTMWNHVRTAASLVAAASFSLALAY